MQLKYRVPLAIKVCTNLACLGLLVWWTKLAVEKYLSQPLATFLSITTGDDNINIVFPHVTFCLRDQSDFIVNTHQTLISDPSFDLDLYLRNQTQRLDHLILDASFPSYSEFSNLPQNVSKGFFITFNGYYGPCMAFDSEMFRLNINELGANGAYLTTLLFELNSSYQVAALLHSKYDSADAMDTNPPIPLEAGKYHHNGEYNT